jgi:hypothetical protein
VLTFLFGIQTSTNLHGFGRVSDNDLYDLGILDRFESSGHWGMPGLSSAEGTRGLSSLNSVMAMTAVASSMLSYS